MQPIVLVPGGAGFLGSHLCERLLADNHEVLAVDNLSTGRTEHVAHLQSNRRFRLQVQDIAESFVVTPAPHRIFNLACPASPAYYLQAPIRTTLTSVIGIWQLLELAHTTGARLFQASTSEVYGDPLEHPQAERYAGNVNPIGPRSCYDEGKRCAEALAFAYHREHALEIRVARLFNSYGPRLRPGDGRVVSNFIVQALTQRPLTVYGDGMQTRSFCYVDDTIEGILRMMESGITGPINIGNPREHTVLELAELVLRLTGSASRIEFRALPVDDPVRRCPDIEAARRALAWEPKVSLEDGLRETIAYFRRALTGRSTPTARVARIDASRREHGTRVAVPEQRLPDAASAQHFRKDRS